MDLISDLFILKEIVSKFLYNSAQEQIVFEAKNVSYKFSSNKIGVHNFSFKEESSSLVAIMGGSGVGKSTFMNVLNGKLKLNEGEITINEFDIHLEQEKIKGIIGYVPQDDLLVEELTVFENLYYNAKFCFKDYSKLQLYRVVLKILIDLDLIEVKHSKVGSPLNKFISGGQRKRLNIALELIREPSILMVDEPTSGLSSTDSEKVMDLLKLQSLKGRLVIVNIHQPSSYVFKLLDKLHVLDKGRISNFFWKPF